MKRQFLSSTGRVWLLVALLVVPSLALAQGTSGLSVAFDLPTQIGYDSDHAMARGEVGRVGVPIDSIADMRRLFEGIPLDRVTTSMTINATAPILLALYLVLAEEQNVSWEQLGGTVQNDILKEYVARGTWIYPPQPSLRLATDLIAYGTSGQQVFLRDLTDGTTDDFTYGERIGWKWDQVLRELRLRYWSPRPSGSPPPHS